MQAAKADGDILFTALCDPTICIILRILKEKAMSLMDSAIISLPYSLKETIKYEKNHVHILQE